MFMCLISLKRTQKGDPHEFFRGILGPKKGSQTVHFGPQKRFLKQFLRWCGMFFLSFRGGQDWKGAKGIPIKGMGKYLLTVKQKSHLKTGLPLTKQRGFSKTPRQQVHPKHFLPKSLEDKFLGIPFLPSTRASKLVKVCNLSGPLQ